MIGGALCLLAAPPVSAGVVLQPGVPFTEAQLEAAMMVRGGPGEGGLDIEVSRPSPDRLALVTPAGRWEIEIGSASGEAAARVVALHVIALAGSAASPAAPAAMVPAAAAVVPETSVVPVAAVPAVAVSAVAVPAAELRAQPPSRAGHRYRLAALGVGSRGVRAGDFSSVGGAIELTRVGRWIIGGGIGWQRGLTIDREPGAPIGADLVRARAVGGVALGPVELVVGGFAGRVLVDGGTGEVGGWALGGVAEARVVARVSAAWAVAAAAGIELFRHRIEVWFEDVRLGATPRAALCGGIGLAWTGGQR